LVLLRADRGIVNTHFRSFAKPMGLAVHGNRLAIGTALEVWEFHNVPAVAAKLEPLGQHHVCFLPRIRHATGEVLIHEMAGVATPPGVPGQEFCNEGREEGALELCFVNTRFSCLCTLDRWHSFVPRWRPPFISALAPDDRCHLNGLAVVNGQVRYATALGET